MSEKSRDIASDSPAQQTTATTQDDGDLAVKPAKGYLAKLPLRNPVSSFFKIKKLPTVLRRIWIQRSVGAEIES
jgi:hypothetical protein